jgi:small-conductance mechanosensitive channel
MTPSIDWGMLISSFFEFLQYRAASLIISLIIIWALYRLLALAVDRYVRDEAARLSVKKWARYGALWLALLWILVIYGLHRQKDVFFLIGIILAAVAISLRDVFSNFIGWFVIISSGIFRERDRVKIGQVTGDVIDIGLFRTVLAEIGEWVESDQSTGRLVVVPNSTVLTQPVYNYTDGHDYIWDELSVQVTFDSDWRLAEKIILDAIERDFAAKEDHIKERLRSARRKYYLTYTYVTPKIYVRIADSGVQLSARYLVRARNRRTLRDQFSRAILDGFGKAPSIALAYPSLALYRPYTDPPPPSSLHSTPEKS